MLEAQIACKCLKKNSYVPVSIWAKVSATVDRNVRLMTGLNALCFILWLDFQFLKMPLNAWFSLNKKVLLAKPLIGKRKTLR
jgi:hypothetical protein